MVQIKEMDEQLRALAQKVDPGTSRREFLHNMAVVSGGVITFGCWLVKTAEAQEATRYGMVVVDYNKCIGCRMCEAACSNSNRTVTINGETLPDIGNPHYSNIRVLTFYPQVDIPHHCVQCNDAPCVASCPIPADPTTKRKALYRDEKTMAVKVDADRCIACGICAKTCSESRTGAILLNPETSKPEGICTLCNGDPACVKYCPTGALSYTRGGMDGRYYAEKPEEIARQLISLWYYNE